jgi:HlyD family secretion protein
MMGTTRMHLNTRRGSAAVKLVIGLVGAVVVAGAGFVLLRGDTARESPAMGATFEVARGPMTVSVTEGGTLQAREQEILVNRVKGRTEIIYVIEEGSMVEAGDLLVELDSSSLMDQKVEKEIRVQNSEAAFIRAQENLAVAKSQAKSDIATAELNHRFAIEDKSRYIEGEFPKERKELESRITLAKEELERAEDRLEGSMRLFDAKYIAESELEGDRLSRNRAQLDYELAVANLALLDEYTYPRRLDELESEIEQTQLALDRVKRKASADTVQAEANLRAAEVEYKRQQTQFEDILDQIQKTKLYAPTAGMVIYATSVNRGGGRWNDDEPLQAGYQAREREELIYLPTASSMMASVSIHESALEKIEVGQQVRVTISAMPGSVFRGQVAKIAPLPDASTWWNPDLRVYSTEIHLDENVGGVRTGMSCRAEIIVAEYEDTVFVPVQAVVRSGRETSVYVQDATGTMTRRQVTIGLDNNKMVNILDGVEPGEVVALAPPLEAPAPTRGRPTPGQQTASAGTAKTNDGESTAAAKTDAAETTEKAQSSTSDSATATATAERAETSTDDAASQDQQRPAIAVQQS